MGIIQRQGIKESMVAYVGVVIGAVSVLVVQPYFLEAAEIGLIKTLIAAATLLMPFIQLGMTATAIKYFPHFQDKTHKHNGFLFFLLSIPIIGFAIVSLVFILAYPYILTHYKAQDSLITAFLAYVLPLALLVNYFAILTAYCRCLFRIVIPSFFQNIVLKSGLILLILLYAFSYLSLHQLVASILGLYLLMTIGLIVYIRVLGHWFVRPNFKKFNTSFTKEIGTYAAYVFLAGFAGIIVLQIDVLMISALKGDASVGIYTIALYIGTVIEIPRRSLSNIAAPVVANAWKNNRLQEIHDLYKRTSIIQFIVGSYLLMCIWASLDDLFLLIPNGQVYATGKYVVLFIGLAKVIDMLTSINNEIILNSKHYRFNFYAMPLLALLTVVTNLFFIPKYGIVGAAIASLVALFLFNIAKLGFIWIKLHMLPFTKNTLKILIISILTYTITHNIPFTQHPITAIFLRSMLITGIFGGLVLWLHISPDINNLANKLKQIIKK